MHAQEMLLDVVGSIELLLAYIAVERLLVAVDVLVAREEISPVGGVGASAAHVALARVADARSRARARDRARAPRRGVARHGAAAAPLAPRLLNLHQPLR